MGHTIIIMLTFPLARGGNKKGGVTMYGYYKPGVKVDLLDREASIFDSFDNDYIRGDSRRRPPDFDLHLAIYVLALEKTPDDLLEPIRVWALENKMAGIKKPLLCSIGKDRQ